MHRTLTSFAGCLTALWSSLAAFPKRLAHKVCRRPWNAPPPCRQGLKVNIPARLFCGLFRWFFGAPEVHLHAYLHLKKPFQRRGADALRPFAFEGIRPHLEPNRASGKAFAGAIRLGHFYVVADKVGSLFLGLDKYGPPFFPPTPLCRVCAAVASEVPLHHVPPLPSLCCGRVVAGQPPQRREIDPTNLPDLGCPGHGRVPEEVGGLQGNGKVFARRGGAR